jgi:hypothetical protein
MDKVQLEVSALLMYVIAAMGTIIGFFCAYFLMKVSKSQERLFSLYDTLAKDVALLQGEHNVLAVKHPNHVSQRR